MVVNKSHSCSTFSYRENNTIIKLSIFYLLNLQPAVEYGHFQEAVLDKDFVGTVPNVEVIHRRWKFFVTCANTVVEDTSIPVISCQ